MPPSPSSIADVIISHMRKQNIDCATIPWDRFHEICERERLKLAFIERLGLELSKRSFLMNEGHSVVTVSKDFNFAELRF
jgi:hypothetical protein